MTLGLTCEGGNTWYWRRDRIPQCRQESWCCAADCPFQAVGDLSLTGAWQVSCCCVLNQHFMLPVGHKQSKNALDI